MAEPNKDKAASPEKQTTGAPQGAPAAQGSSAKAQDGPASSVAGTEGADAGVDPEELLDAVLEAEAAAVVDNAMDEVQAEAAAADAQREVAEWKDKYMRLHAEWDTYRRRTKEQQEVQKALAAEKLVTSLLPILDDLERSIDYAKSNGETGLLSGVEAVLAKFIDTLQKDGVDVIDPAGDAFDALEAQAVGTVDDASQPDETVAEVYQKGYKMGTKVLRPAMVTVTTGGPKRPKPDTEEGQAD